MFTVLFFSHGSCHPKFKIKATSSKHSWLSHNFSSGSNFYFYSNSLQRVRNRSRNRGFSIGAMGVIFSFWVVGTAQLPNLYFLDAGTANIHLDFFTPATFVFHRRSQKNIGICLCRLICLWQ